MTALFLKLHRWVALLFAVPLLVIIGTGLLLSVEPSLVVGKTVPGSLSAARIEALLARHDPAGKARSIGYRSYDNTLAIGGGRGSPPAIVDAATGEPTAGPGALATVLMTSRRLHERLLIDAEWLVIASTIAMLGIIVLGGLMGLPRFANTLSGWHKGTAWVLIPLVVLSPLTGLAIAFGVTLTGAAPGSAAQGPPVKLVEAVRMLGREHDLSGLIWVRERRGEMLARLVKDGEYRVFTVTSTGTAPTPRNWPRLLHEGNYWGHVSAAINVVTSLALLLLLVTGVWIWTRRSMRRRRAARVEATA